ncbi:MAG: bifunctional oligoribonuclease/PAP phosphatase NrnA [Candidatus Sumerlaeaceae bacterium]|nr:bifunctional oligoribonuclease/PAP phosphatase NrnA [Candidatus Sumerlaeaceae bacterium]
MTASEKSGNGRGAEPPVVGEICEVIRRHQEFLIVGHGRPDGDCLGSCLGLYAVLRQMGKDVRFFTPGPIQDFFSFLPYLGETITEHPAIRPGEIIIYVDCGDFERVDEVFKPEGFIINIDHHLSNAFFGNLNWVDTEACAAGELIYRLALALGEPISPEAATCLFTAIMADTGGFRFSNTDRVTFETAAALVAAGANPAAIAEAVFENRKPRAVYITGVIYQTLKYEFDGRLVWNELRRDIYELAGGDEYEPEGLCSDLRGIAGVEVSVLFHETPDGWCRVGLRSKGRVNVSRLAQMLGGGGHHNASGAYIKQPYDQARDRALDVIRAYLAECFSTASPVA